MGVPVGRTFQTTLTPPCLATLVVVPVAKTAPDVREDHTVTMSASEKIINITEKLVMKTKSQKPSLKSYLNQWMTSTLQLTVKVLLEKLVKLVKLVNNKR